MEKEKVVEAAKLLNATVYEDAAADNVAPLIKKKIKVVAIGVEDLIATFMAACETISEDLEIHIPDAVSDVYNTLGDEGYTSSGTVPQAAQATIPKEPIKATPQAATIPKEPAKPVTSQTKPPVEEKKKLVEVKRLPATTQIMMIVVDNPEFTVGKIQEAMTAKEYEVTDGTIAIQRNDTLKTLAYLQAKEAKAKK